MHESVTAGRSRLVLSAGQSAPAAGADANAAPSPRSTEWHPWGQKASADEQHHVVEGVDIFTTELGAAARGGGAKPGGAKSKGLLVELAQQLV